MKRPLLSILFLGIAIAAVFRGVLQIETFRFDDANHLVDLAPMKAESWSGILYFWKHPTIGAYAPVTNSVWFVLTKLGASPRDFYAVNLSVYFLSVLAAYFALTPFMTAGAALLGASWFALHPLHVEPVAWITALRDLLAGLFSLVSLGSYVRFAQEKGRKWYALATVSFLFAVLSKNTAFALPLVLGAIATFYFRRPLSRQLKDFLPWVPFLPILTFHASLHGPIAHGLVPEIGWGARLLVALDAVSFYLSKALFPIGLSYDYGRTPSFILSQPIVLVTPLAMAALVAYYALKRDRVALMILGIFVGSLALALGLQPFVFQHISTVADRYAFLALFGPALGLGLLAQRSLPARVAIGIWCAALAFLTTVEVKAWRNEGLLYHRMVALNDRSWFGYGNLGLLFERRGEIEGAIVAYRRGIRRMPELPKRSVLCIRLGSLYLERARFLDALGAFTEAALLDEKSAVAQHGLGMSWFRLGDNQKAKRHFEAALALQPNLEMTRQNLAHLETLL